MDKGLRTALIIGGVVVGLLILVPIIFSLVGGGQTYGYGMMGNFGGFSAMMIIMPVLFVIFWGLVIWGIVAFIRSISSSGGGSPASGESALEVLKKRYARGEISKAEFEEKKKDLT